MTGILGLVLNFVFGMLGLQKKTPAAKPLERVGRAEAANDAERANREELARVIDARRAADAKRLRDEGAGVATADPAAPVNRDDGFRRD